MRPPFVDKLPRLAPQTKHENNSPKSEKLNNLHPLLPSIGHKLPVQLTVRVGSDFYWYTWTCVCMLGFCVRRDENAIYVVGRAKLWSRPPSQLLMLKISAFPHSE
jgi:hypothetical protein